VNEAKHAVCSKYKLSGQEYARDQACHCRPKGFGFIEFKDPRDADNALNGLDGSEFMGREIQVCLSKESRKTPREMLHRERQYPSSYQPRDRDRDRDRHRDRDYDRRRDHDRDYDRDYGRGRDRGYERGDRDRYRHSRSRSRSPRDHSGSRSPRPRRGGSPAYDRDGSPSGCRSPVCDPPPRNEGYDSPREERAAEPVEKGGGYAQDDDYERSPRPPHDD